MLHFPYTPTPGLTTYDLQLTTNLGFKWGMYILAINYLGQIKGGCAVTSHSIYPCCSIPSPLMNLSSSRQQIPVAQVVITITV